MPDLQHLYQKGLLFLKDLADEFNSNADMINLVMNTFFNGKYSDSQFRTLKYLQTDSYINTCLKNIAYILERIYTKFGKDAFPIRIDTFNTRNILLPPYMNTELCTDTGDAYICFKELVIPLVYGNLEHSTYITQCLRKIREIVGMGSCTLESLIVDVGELLEPVYSFPTEDTYYGFIYINPNSVTAECKNILGIFTNTEFFRITNIGKKMYIEFIKDTVLYKHMIINIHTEKGQLELYNALKYAQAIKHPTTLLTNYQKNRREILLCQEIR